MNGGGGGNEMNGLLTVCHEARKSGYIGSQLPNHVRAFTLLDQSFARSNLSRLRADVHDHRRGLELQPRPDDLPAHV